MCFATHMRQHGKFEYLKPLYISILPMAPRPRKLLYLLSAGKQQTQRELILSVEALISQDHEGLSRSVQVKKLSTVAADKETQMEARGIVSKRDKEFEYARKLIADLKAKHSNAFVRKGMRDHR